LGDRDAVVSGVLDKGFGKKFTSTTVHKGVYAFIFDQKGLMGGVGIGRYRRIQDHQDHAGQ
jgi:hypothetical protein